ncbi:MAG: chaperone NapD [Nitrospirae bacterium]|nr:chaperone NapD [Nitrospirota bacterium]MCL5237335.1 chaperone NapD [Nitrospirota bacterium]
MAVTSVVVEFKDDASEAVLSSLARIDNVTVYGIKDNQIVAVIEGADMSAVEETMKSIYALEKITGVYPVFAGDE